MAVDWAYYANAMTRIPSFGESFQKGMEQGQRRRALDAYANNPDDPQAWTAMVKADPATAIKLSEVNDRRAYRPASNSAHLDGSSFDLLPPPGKSMGWLKMQVKRYDRTVRLLDEGDHLHVTFPGYFGAPPIGGASKAGLRNPLAGMPPPPPGFQLDQR